MSDILPWWRSLYQWLVLTANSWPFAHSSSISLPPEVCHHASAIFLPFERLSFCSFNLFTMVSQSSILVFTVAANYAGAISIRAGRYRWFPLETDMFSKWDRSLCCISDQASSSDPFSCRLSQWSFFSFSINLLIGLWNESMKKPR